MHASKLIKNNHIIIKFTYNFINFVGNSIFLDIQLLLLLIIIYIFRRQNRFLLIMMTLRPAMEQFLRIAKIKKQILT